jgi:hypothetical protein
MLWNIRRHVAPIIRGNNTCHRSPASPAIAADASCASEFTGVSPASLPILPPLTRQQAARHHRVGQPCPLYKAERQSVEAPIVEGTGSRASIHRSPAEPAIGGTSPSRAIGATCRSRSRSRTTPRCRRPQHRRPDPRCTRAPAQSSAAAAAAQDCPPEPAQPSTASPSHPTHHQQSPPETAGSRPRATSMRPIHMSSRCRAVRIS